MTTNSNLRESEIPQGWQYIGPSIDHGNGAHTTTGTVYVDMYSLAVAMVMVGAVVSNPPALVTTWQRDTLPAFMARTGQTGFRAL